MDGMAPSRAAAPWAATKRRGGQDPLVALLRRCEGSLGWIPPKSKAAKPVDDSKLDFSACDGDTERMDLVRADARRRAESNAEFAVYRIEAVKLRRAMEKNPRLLTVANLDLALEYCWRKRIQILTPLALIYHVEAALELASAPVRQVDIMDQRDEAIEYEQHRGDGESDRWMRRLTRARGAGLVDVLASWKHVRGMA